MAASIKMQMWKKIKRNISPSKWVMYVFDPHYPLPVMTLLLLAELVVNILVIIKIKYTEIDWVAYMQEVEGVVNGTYDYTQLKGDTGPLVYPAGFVYIFTVLYYLTGRGNDIRLAQYIFAVLYLITLIVIFDIYRRAKKVPPYVFFFMCCASYRIHSIYILRMFNDPVAMLFMYAAIDLFLANRWSLGCLMYSLGVSIKMNLLLFSPAVFVLLLVSQGVVETVKNLTICAVTQVILATPFLLSNPWGYIVMSFNLGRQFFYKWTVNWRLVPEDIFLNKYFQAALLLGHVIVLLGFIFIKWKRYLPLGEVRLSKTTVQLTASRSGKSKICCGYLLESPHRGDSNKYPQLMFLGALDTVFLNIANYPPHLEILLPLFTANFIGMCFSRTLHYQFYVWYFHGLHFLLWSTSLPVVIRVLILGIVELSWNTYPSTVLSSSLLHLCHGTILLGLWSSPEYTQYTKKKTVAQKMS